MRTLFGLALCCLSMLSSAAEDGKVQYKSHTRETNYTIGSVAQQHVEILVPSGYQLDQGSLPQQAQAAAVEVRSIHWSQQDQADHTRYLIDIDWQIFVAYEVVRQVPLKPLVLRFHDRRHDKDETLAVTVPADKVLVSTLLPPKMDEAHLQLYPDIEPPEVDLSRLWWLLGLALLGLVLSMVYIAWYLGWIRLPFEKHMPIRQAWRHIKRLPTSQADANQTAMQLLAKGVSAYAGFTVTAENVAVLNQRTAIQPYAASLTRFYQDIQQTFFAGQSPQHDLTAIRKLAKALSHLEVS